ncbi:serine/threonine phosphatase [Baaleninema sp.]|uniref:serine/threonine phosphatase n=1 Tax=Baaleninema sp. TaxID=3101197 RepID=UPI003D00DFF2
MLVCPHCHTLNPKDRESCSQCGAPLPSQNPIWFAAVVSAKFTASTLPPYLDSQQRYRFFDLGKLNEYGEIETRAYDLHPQLPPYFTNGVSSYSTDNQVPDLARPYLHPRCQSNSALPRLQDTWHNNGHTVVLLEDRSTLPRVLDRWRTVSSLQRLYWMYQMLDLWSILTALSCRSSLTQLHNLHLDGDRAICLQRLYSDPSDRPLTLTVLAQAWRTLFQSLSEPPPSDIARFLQQVERAILDHPQSIGDGLDDLIDRREEEDSEPTAWDDIESLEEEDITVTAPIAPVVYLEHGGKTDIGRHRPRNEDTFAIWTQRDFRETPAARTVTSRGLYVLCDGMGGHEGGDIASSMAAEIIVETLSQQWGDDLPNETAIREAIDRANRAIYDLNQDQSRQGSGRMGTTLVMLLVNGDRAAVAHVGDSRLYRLTARGGLQQLTTDHEVGQHAIRQGIDPAVAYSRPEAYQLTQALGPRDNDALRPDVRFFNLSENTLFLLASDGLTDNNLVEIYWETHLQPFLRESSDLDAAATELINLANTQNGRDNITAVLVRVSVRSQP